MLENQKNAGLELLRIVSMLMIIGHHFLIHGGVLTSAPMTFGYNAGHLLEAFFIYGVNCFVLISGYFLVAQKSFRWKKIIYLWCSIFFWCFVTAVIASLFHVRPNWWEVFAPITHGAYWFMTCYMGLYLIAPFLNVMLNHLDKRNYRNLLMILFVLFSILTTQKLDPFRIHDGYSLLWFINLYIIAGYIRLYGVKVSKVASLSVYAVLSLVLFGCFWNHHLVVRYFNVTPAYNTWMVVIASVALFLFFKDLSIKNIPFRRYIFFFAPLTFGIYLIHDNNLVRPLWKTLPIHQFLNPPLFLVDFIVTVLAVFLLCAFLEKGRIMIFNKIEWLYASHRASS